MGTLWLALAGIVLLVRYARVERACRGGDRGRSWLVVPLALMSMGTSKLHHYAYPFLPPLALAAGFGPGWLLRRTGAAASSVHARAAGSS